MVALVGSHCLGVRQRQGLVAGAGAGEGSLGGVLITGGVLAGRRLRRGLRGAEEG